MKRYLIMALVAAFVLAMSGAALAFPVEFNGDFRLQARSLDDGIGVDEAYKTSFFQLRARLSFTGKIDDDTALFGRFSARNNFGGDQTGNGQAFDQYGVKYNTGDWNFSIGRQAVTLGQGTIISTGYDAVGVDNKFDGLVATTKWGKVDVTIMGGKTNKISVPDQDSYAIMEAKSKGWYHDYGWYRNSWCGPWYYGLHHQYGWNSQEFIIPDAAIPRGSQWYGIDFSTKLDDKLAAGLTYAYSKLDSVTYIDPWGNEKFAATKGVKYWGLNANYNASKNFSMNGEYVKSDADKNDRAFFVAGTYSWDRNSFTVQYNNVQYNAVDQFNSGIGAVAYPFAGIGLMNGDTGYKGFTYVWNHNMTKAASLHVIYMDLKVDGVGGSDKEAAAGVVWKF